jgi:hypothetical protein
MKQQAKKGKVKPRTLKTEGCGTHDLLTALRVLHPPSKAG